MRFCSEIYFQLVILELYGIVSWFPSFFLAPMAFAMSSVLMCYLTWTSSYCSLLISFIISHTFLFIFFWVVATPMRSSSKLPGFWQNSSITHLLCLLRFYMPQFPFLLTASISVLWSTGACNSCFLRFHRSRTS